MTVTAAVVGATKINGRVDASAYVKAMLNVLEDFSGERGRTNDTQRAILNILEDFSDEKTRLSDTQRAVLNILEDFDAEKRKVAELEMFAYVASHDLQEPLRMITSYTQLLARRYGEKLDADADEFIRFIVDGTLRMQALIRDLLEYSRVGSRELNFRATDCEQVLQQVLTDLKALQEETGAVVTHDPLPTVLADESQMTQLFQNLITNAIKFRGPEVPVVHLGAEPVSGGWRLSVRDNGIGIEPAYRERVFEAFQRLHSREYPGTGVGLAICQRIADRHGGRIWVESAPGRGSTFFFTLTGWGHDQAQ